jgi:pimeloyl-ACP methyl ester carboxylesterase
VPVAVPNASVESIPASDEVLLDARLFDGGSRRLVIFLHAFDRSQQEWWPWAEVLVGRGEASALTFDFRGYGASGGEFAPEHLVADVQAAVEFARDRAYEGIVLVGASMGGTAAIVAASQDPSVRSVVALSAPHSFGDLDALEAIEAREPERLVFMAARGDVSGADSLRLMRDAAGLTTRDARMFDGTDAHGTALLTSDAGEEAQSYLWSKIAEAWR